jgi:hypothetical protein
MAIQFGRPLASGIRVLALMTFATFTVQPVRLGLNTTHLLDAHASFINGHLDQRASPQRMRPT